MSQSFHCPNCGAPLDLPRDGAASIRCPFCSSSVLVPAQSRSAFFREDTLSSEQAMANLPDLGGKMMEVIALVKDGNKAEAVKRFREVFDTSMTVANLAIEQIEGGQVVMVSDIQSISREAEGFQAPYFTARQVETSFSPSARRATKGLLAGILGSTGCMMLLVVGMTLGIIGITMLMIFIQPGEFLYEAWQKINPFNQNKLVLAFGEEGIGQGLINDPRAMAVDAEGNIFVADFNTGRIQMFDPEGNFTRLWDAGEEVIINAMDVDREGILYVVARGEVLRYDTRSDETLAPLPNPLDFYFDDINVTADGGLAAVADGDSLVRLTRGGDVIWSVEEAISIAADDSELDTVIAVDGDGYVYAVGSFTYSVFKFSPEGRFITRWGSDGNEEGQFTAPTGIFVDEQGRVYASDFSGILVFENDGRFVELIDVPRVVFDLKIAPGGLLYTVDNTPRVRVVQLK